MRHAYSRSQVLFMLAVLGTVAAAFLPARYLGWTREVAAIVRFPFTPMGQAGNALTAWLRPAQPAPNPYGEDDVDFLVSEIEHLRALLEAERRRAADLAQQLWEVQRVGSEYTSVPVRPLLAKITARDATKLIGPVELNRGRRAGVTVDTVAVFDRVHLIGRVTDVATVQSTLTPIAYEKAGLITAAVMPADRPDVRIDQAPKVQLQPVGNGTFAGDVANTHAIAIGDVVRLIDSTWPETAQAMIIGEVESVEPKPQMPLRNIIIVRPHYQVYELFRITLKIEDEDAYLADPRQTGTDQANTSPSRSGQ